ncbi:transcription factor TamA [Botrytis cinerea]
MGLPMMGTPPVQGYAPPPPQQRQAPPPPAQVAEPDADALMAQVMAMPQELIDSLPPADRAQLMALRAQFRG